MTDGQRQELTGFNFYLNIITKLWIPYRKCACINNLLSIATEMCTAAEVTHQKKMKYTFC